MITRVTLLEGIVGSTAYGLARAGSDVDRLGVFGYPAQAFWGLTVPEDTYCSHEPDVTHHEIGKYMSLALKCNPTVLELLWLEDYEIMTSWGAKLIELRDCFLSESYVRNAYGGYARQQAERLQRRNAEGKDSFSSDTKKRTAKHARHIFRLLRQGRELLETGYIQIRLEDPETYWAFDNYSVGDIVKKFAEEDTLFRETKSILPTAPNLWGSTELPVRRSKGLAKLVSPTPCSSVDRVMASEAIRRRFKSGQGDVSQ